jgi:hypothetical protein
MLESVFQRNVQCPSSGKKEKEYAAKFLFTVVHLISQHFAGEVTLLTCDVPRE